jgi:hypothetical protein
MKIAISQSNYIPWRGYFDAIAGVDCFVLYDEMQYTKRDWRNRNKILSNQKELWLSIPVEVKGKYFQKIKDTKTLDRKWIHAHLQSIKHAYSKSACALEVMPFIEDLYHTCHFDFLSDINLHFLKGIMGYLEIDTRLESSSNFQLPEGKTEKLIHICKKLGASAYYTGPAAKSYMDEYQFIDNQIELNYWDNNNYPSYKQGNQGFVNFLSIIDTLFHTGKDTSKYMKYVALKVLMPKSETSTTINENL